MGRWIAGVSTERATKLELKTQGEAERNQANVELLGAGRRLYRLVLARISRALGPVGAPESESPAVVGATLDEVAARIDTEVLPAVAAAEARVELLGSAEERREARNISGEIDELVIQLNGRRAPDSRFDATNLASHQLRSALDQFAAFLRDPQRKRLAPKTHCEHIASAAED